MKYFLLNSGRRIQNSISILLFLSFIPILSYSADSVKGPFFWQVEKDNRTFHILGTIHQGISLDELQCSNTISNVLNKSNEVWIEIDFQAEVEEDSFAEESYSKGQDKNNQASLTSSLEQQENQEIDQPKDSFLSSLVSIFSVKQENQEIDPIQVALNNFKPQDQQTIEKENQEMQQLKQSISMDDSGQSFQSLSEENKSILANLINSNNLQDEIKPTNLSYFGLIMSLLQICAQNNIDFINQKSSEFTNSDLSGSLNLASILDLEIQQLAQEKGIPQYYLDDQQRLDNMLLKQGLKEVDLFFSKEGVEKMIKDYDHLCSEEKLAEKIEANYNLSIESIAFYKDGSFLDASMERDIQNARRSGATEEAITSYVDFFNNDILKARNEYWLEKLFSAYDNQIENIFVAAGVAHFEGSFSVLNMLEDQDFTIKRMGADCTFK